MLISTEPLRQVGFAGNTVFCRNCAESILDELYDLISVNQEEVLISG